MMPSVIAKDVHGNEYSVPAGELSFWVSVYGVVVKDGRVLVLPQFGKGFDFPGGKIDKGEELPEALVREVREETGLTVRPLEFLNVYTSFFKGHKDGKFYHCLLFYYLCEAVSGEISDAGFSDAEKEYAETARFADIAELPNMNFIAGADMKDLIARINRHAGS